MKPERYRRLQNFVTDSWSCVLWSYWLLGISLTLLYTFLYTPHTVLAQISDTQVEATQRSSRECASCRQRKQTLCVQECASVPYASQRDCRFRCINEYCTHRCSSKLALNWPDLSCKECQKEEVTLCQPLCKRGTPFEVAKCKTQCAAKRCEHICELEKDSKTRKSQAGSTSSLEPAAAN